MTIICNVYLFHSFPKGSTRSKEERGGVRRIEED